MEENNNDNKENNDDSQKNTIYTSEDTSIKRFGNTNYTSSTEITPKDIISCSKSQSISSQKINPTINRFPYCIVWTPIPLLTYIIPSIGHVGIATSSGVIHDFAGSFFVSVDDFAFGKPTKYIQLDLSEQEKYEYDRAIEKGDNKYNMEEHNLCMNNCHSHVAYILNQFKFKGKSNYTMVHIWWLLIMRGKYISCCSFIKTYIGFFIFIFIIWLIIHKR